MARITQFDASQFACQIAAEVKNFDPLQFVEKKELKKMGRFIHLVLAATDEAMKASGLEVTAGDFDPGWSAYRVRNWWVRCH